MLMDHWFSFWRLVPMMAAGLLLAALACGGAAATPVVIEKEVVNEVPKEVVVEKVVAEPAAAGGGSRDWVKQGKKGGSVHLYGTANPELWDPHRGATRNSIHPTRSMFNGLVMYSPFPPTDQIIGDLAESWEVSNEGLTYTFHIHENVKWWDGQPVTAEDVAFSLDRMVEEGKPRPRTGVLRNFYKNSEVIDPTTVEVNLTFPAAAFLPFLAIDYMMILPKHVVESGVDIGIPANIVGSGPFKHVGYERGASYEFERNPDYFREGLPFLDGAKVFIINDSGRATTALLTEQVLGMSGWGSGMTSREMAAITRDSGGKVWAPQVATGYGGVFVNFHKKPFDDPKVRKAIYLALDRREIGEAAFGVGEFLPATVFFPGSITTEEELGQIPGHRYTPDGKKDPRDLEEAKRLMAEAGYTDGVKATFDVSTNSVDVAQAPFLKKQLAVIGLDLELTSFEGSVMSARRASGDYEVNFIRHGMSIRDADETFTSTYLPLGSRNQLGYEDPRVTEAFEKQTRELDPDERRRFQREASEVILQGEGHWFTTYWYFGFAPKNVKLQNIHAPPSIHVLQTLEHIWLDPDAKP